jgi:hypothetical protein
VALILAAGFVVAVVLSVLAVRFADRRHDGVLRSRTRERVLVTLSTDDAFSGVLYDFDGRALVLRDAIGHGMNGDKREDVGVDGEVVMLWDDVAYLQVV